MKLQSRDIRDNLVSVLSDRSTDYKTFIYQHPESGRQFEIREMTKYWLCEMTPNGRLVELDDAGNCIRGWDEPQIHKLEKEAGPNGLLDACKNAGINPAQMVFVGAGFSVNSRYFESLSDCLEAIRNAIENNERYWAYRELSSSEKDAQRLQEKRASVQYWESQIQAANKAMQDSWGFLKGAHNLMGPLPESIRFQILDYVNAPSQEKWLEVRGLCITPGTTLWQAWAAADNKAPSGGNHGYPDGALLRTALRQAIDQAQETARQRLAAAREAVTLLAV